MGVLHVKHKVQKGKKDEKEEISSNLMEPKPSFCLS